MIKSSNLTMRIAILLLALIWFHLLPAWADSNDLFQLQKIAENTELQNDAKHIQSLIGKTNLDDFQKAASDLDKKWAKKGDSEHAVIVLVICQFLSSSDFGVQNTYKKLSLCQDFARVILNENNHLPLDVEVGLVEQLTADVDITGEVKGGAWAKLRTEKAKLWLHPLQRIQAAIDKNFDFSQKPLLNVVPPANTGMPAGVAPEAIADLKLRAEYEAAIHKNAQVVEKFNEQYMLRQLERRFWPQLERYLIQAYSNSPYNLEELKRYLDLYITDEDRKKRILAPVIKEMKLTVEGITTLPATPTAPTQNKK